MTRISRFLMSFLFGSLLVLGPLATSEGDAQARERHSSVSAKQKVAKQKVAKHKVVKHKTAKRKASASASKNRMVQKKKSSKTRSAARKNTRRSLAARHYARPIAVRSHHKTTEESLFGTSPGLASAEALVIDARTGQVLYGKHSDQALPIASITKLMTAMVVLDARLPLHEAIAISNDDVDQIKHTSSRLEVGTTLTRAEVMLLALMSSENRAASALGHNYPGGLPAFVHAMNNKARSLGMNDSSFVDSSGLSANNRSSVKDLATMVKAAYRYPEIRQFSTTTEYDFVSRRGSMMHYKNTNALVKQDDWDIGLSKTGFINEAGKCLVMQATIADVPVIMVLMDSQGKYTRIADATRVRQWLETSLNAWQARGLSLNARGLLQ